MSEEYALCKKNYTKDGEKWSPVIRLKGARADNLFEIADFVNKGDFSLSLERKCRDGAKRAEARK